MSQESSRERRTEAVSVEKYGCPVPHERNTKIPFSRECMALFASNISPIPERSRAV